VLSHWDTLGPALLAWLGVLLILWRGGSKAARAILELADAARGNTRELGAVRGTLRDLQGAFEGLESTVGALKRTTESHGRQLEANGRQLAALGAATTAADHFPVTPPA
jgi:hypothetical protein